VSKLMGMRRYYTEYVSRTVEDIRQGRRPIAGLQEMGRAVQVVEAGYASAESARLFQPHAESATGSRD
jgi:hypothetical protein